MATLWSEFGSDMRDMFVGVSRDDGVDISPESHYDEGHGFYVFASVQPAC